MPHKWLWITLKVSRMDRRRLRQNVFVLFFSLVIFLSVWQIITGPGPPLFNQIEEEPISIFYTPITPNSTYTYPMSTLNKSDYSHLIDISNFSFTIFNAVCNETHPFVIILVHSAPKNTAKRMTIRETWGHTGSMKVLFMLGQVNNATLQKELEDENDIHGDFIQGTFLDTYRNVTYKHAMVFKYAIYHCKHAKYLLKTDDDVFINVIALYDFLYDLSPNGARNLLLCTPQKDALAMRSYRSKWRVSYQDYPHRHYPPYCPGWGLLYSNDVAFMLYKELQNRSYFWIDDVLITGIIFKELNLSHSTLKILMLTKEEQRAILHENYTAEMRPFLYGRAEMTEGEIRTMWNYTSKFMKGHNQIN